MILVGKRGWGGFGGRVLGKRAREKASAIIGNDVCVILALVSFVLLDAFHGRLD